MLVYEYKLDGNIAQYTAMDEAIRVTQFVRNKCLRLWMDADKDQRVNANDLQVYCSQLAKEVDFASKLNSQARQAAADRAWNAIQRFYDNCKAKRPGKKAIPTFSMTTVRWNTKPLDGNWSRMESISSSRMAAALGGCEWSGQGMWSHSYWHRSSGSGFSSGPMATLSSLSFRRNAPSLMKQQECSVGLTWG